MQKNLLIGVVLCTAALALIAAMLACPALREVQTFIVGVLGFAGVAWSIRQGAMLSREQHEREVAHEREALRLSLLAELKGGLETFDYNIEGAAAANKCDLIVPTTTWTQIYESQLGRLGLLSSDQLRVVTNAYTHLQQFQDRVQMIVARFNEGGVSSIQGFSVVPNNSIRFYTAHMEAVRKAVAEAIHALEQ